MSDELEQQARALRRSFDAGFAVPAERPRVEHEQLLAIRAGGSELALRARQVVRLATEAPTVPLPGPVEGLIGLCALRGEMVPVYGLGALLGLPALDEPRWLALCGGRLRAALAFEALEGQLRVERGALVEPAEPHALMTQVARLPDGDRPIVDVPAVLALIARRCGVEQPSKEP